MPDYHRGMLHLITGGGLRGGGGRAGKGYFSLQGGVRFGEQVRQVFYTELLTHSSFFRSGVEGLSRFFFELCKLLLHRMSLA